MLQCLCEGEMPQVFRKILLQWRLRGNAYNFSGDICGAYDIGCELQKKRIECAIMIKAAEEEQKNEEE